MFILKNVCTECLMIFCRKQFIRIRSIFEWNKQKTNILSQIEYVLKAQNKSEPHVKCCIGAPVVGVVL